jgi:Fe-S cluster biogenesis protein NfuA
MSLESRVEAALESVRPYLKADGGDVKLLEITEDNIVKIEMLGACNTCSISSMTIKGGLEHTVISSVPEIKAVQAIEK